MYIIYIIISITIIIYIYFVIRDASKKNGCNSNFNPLDEFTYSLFITGPPLHISNNNFQSITDVILNCEFGNIDTFLCIILLLLIGTKILLLNISIYTIQYKISILVILNIQNSLL